MTRCLLKLCERFSFVRVLFYFLSIYCRRLSSAKAETLIYRLLLARFYVYSQLHCRERRTSKKQSQVFLGQMCMQWASNEVCIVGQIESNEEVVVFAMGTTLCTVAWRERERVKLQSFQPALEGGNCTSQG